MQNKLDTFTRIVVVLSLLALVLSLLPAIGYGIKLAKEPKTPSSVVIELEKIKSELKKERLETEKERLIKEKIFNKYPRIRRYF